MSDFAEKLIEARESRSEKLAAEEAGRRARVHSRQIDRQRQADEKAEAEKRLEALRASPGTDPADILDDTADIDYLKDFLALMAEKGLKGSTKLALPLTSSDYGRTILGRRKSKQRHTAGYPIGRLFGRFDHAPSKNGESVIVRPEEYAEDPMTVYLCENGNLRAYRKEVRGFTELPEGATFRPGVLHEGTEFVDDYIGQEYEYAGKKEVPSTMFRQESLQAVLLETAAANLPQEQSLQ